MNMELEQYLRDMRAKSAKENKGKQGRKADNQEAGVENREGEGNQLTGDTGSVNTDVDLSQQQGKAAESNDAVGAGNSEEGTETTMSKKAVGGSKKKETKAAKGPKPAKAEKAPKAPKAPKGERKPREKKLASGKLKKVEATGNTYITLEFEEGKIVLTPTGNREANRDLAVKALRALL
jgi:hypothetical protein